MIHTALECLHRSGIFRLVRLWPNRHFIVLNFHRVGDTPSEFHDGLIEVSSADFRKHLEWIGQRAEFISEDQIKALRPGGKPKVLLTFDDGYRDVYDVTVPILEKLSIPAIFFVASGMLDNRILGAWDRIAYLVKKYPEKRFQFRGRNFSLEEGTRAAYLELGEWSQASVPDRGEEFVSDLAATLGVAPPDPAKMSQELLTWEQVRSIRKKGFPIGGHGLTHHVLSSLTLDEQALEIAKSKARLHEEKIPARSFAIPFGSPESYSWETCEAAREAGFEFVFSFSGIAPRIKQLNPTLIDRVAFKSTLAKYNFVLSLPSFYNFYQKYRIRGRG